MLLGCNVGVGEESSSNTSTAVSKAMIHDGNNAQQLLHHTSSDETSKSAKNSFNDDFSDDFDAFNAAPIETVSDPLSQYNRTMFKINDKLDKYLIKPVAELYNKIIPRPLNLGVDNFFNNLLGTQIIVNDLLQANFYQSTRDSWRFAIDTTVGVGGFFDIGDRVGLPYEQNGVGLTLAKWGYVNSSYLVLPLLGSSTIRDAISLPIDYFLTPIPYVANIALRNSLFGLGLLDKRALFLGFQGVYNEMALDPYIFMRNAYLQRRTYLIKRVDELDNPYTTQNTRQLKRNYYLNE